MAVTVTVPDQTSRYGWDFDKSVIELFPYPLSREYFRKTLRQYEIGFISAGTLARRLIELVKDPANMTLFDLVRTVVRLEDQIEYNLGIPVYTHTKTERLTLDRRYLGEDFGFRACGGRDQDCAIIVCRVDRPSIAWDAGLRPGYHITRVNGLSTAKSTHRMFADFVRISMSLELHVKNVGMIPKPQKNKPTSWKFPTAQDMAGHLVKSIVEVNIPGDKSFYKEFLVYFKTLQGTVLGTHVRLSPAGLKVTSLKPGSAAVVAKIQPDDEIIEVNNKRLDGLDFEECVARLRCETPFTLRIRRAM